MHETNAEHRRCILLWSLLLANPNAKLIRINPREAEGPDGTIGIPLSALEALERIDAELSGNLKMRASSATRTYLKITKRLE